MFGATIQGAVPYAQDNFTLATNQHIPFAKRFPTDGTNFVLNDLTGMLRRQTEQKVMP